MVGTLLAIYLLVGGVVLGVPRMSCAAVAPAAVALVLLLMHKRGWGNGDIVVIAAGGIVLLGQRWLESEYTTLPALVMLIALGGTLAMIGKKSRRWRLLIPWALILGAAPAWWEGLSAHGISTGITAFLSFTLLAPLAISARNVMNEGERRYSDLFEHLPITVLEQDWDPVRERMQQLREEGVTNLRSHLSIHPELVAEMMGQVVTVDANPWAARMLGTDSPEDLMGPLGSNRVHSRNWLHFANQLVAVWESDQMYRSQFQTQTHDGKDLWVQLRWIDTAVTNPGERGTVIVAASDMTETKLAERKAERLASLRGELIDAVGHELRTPLSVVVGLAEQLTSSHHSFGTEDLDDLLTMLGREAGTVASIVDNLVTASLLETEGLRLNSCDFDLITATRRAATDTGVRLIGDDTGPIMVSADEERTHQLLRNLMINCAHYGSTTLELLAKSTATEARITLSARGGVLASSGIHSILREDGCIDTDGMTTGFGLSLGVSRDLATKMTGKLVFTREDAGVFTLKLPAAVPATVEVADSLASLGDAHVPSAG